MLYARSLGFFLVACAVMGVITGCGKAQDASRADASSARSKQQVSQVRAPAPPQTTYGVTPSTIPATSVTPPPAENPQTPPVPQQDPEIESLKRTIDQCEVRLKQLDEWADQYNTQVEACKTDVEIAISEGRPITEIQQLRAKVLEAMEKNLQVCRQQIQVLQVRDAAKFQLAMRYKAIGQRDDAVSLLREVSASQRGFPLGEQALRELNAMGE